MVWSRYEHVRPCVHLISNAPNHHDERYNKSCPQSQILSVFRIFSHIHRPSQFSSYHSIPTITAAKRPPFPDRLPKRIAEILLCWPERAKPSATSQSIYHGELSTRFGRFCAAPHQLSDVDGFVRKTFSALTLFRQSGKSALGE